MRAWLARLDNDVSRALGVFVLACLAYLPALAGTLVWDDDAHITRGALQDLDGLRRIWFELGATQQYYPVLHSAFWLEHRLWGESVVGYHLTNVALHAFAACLIVVLCQRLAIRGAWWAALLFLLHPVAVESVAWISEQKNTLSLVFYLMAAIGWQQFDAQRRGRDWALATLLFAAALATKTVTATLPGGLLVVVWWQRGRIEFRRDVIPLLPWIAMATAGGLTTAWVERHVIGASGAEFALDGWQRILLAAHAVWHYLATLAWPFGLVFMYPRWTIDPRAAASYDYLVAVVLIVVTLFILQVRTRAPLAAFLIFAGSLFPVMGFLNVYPFRYSFVADHFQYHASIALFVLAGAGISVLLQRAQHRRGAVYAAVFVLFGALGALTWRHAADFRDAETLYRATLARNPSSWMAHHNLGRLVSRKPGGLDEAIAHFDSALALKPDHARAHYALGVALQRVGRGAEAVPHFEAAIRLEPGNPLLVANAHYLLGQLLRDKPGALEQAIAHMKEAVRLKGTVAESHNTLGEMQLAAGHPEEARREFAAALRLQPGYAAAQANLQRLDASSSLPRSR